MFYAIYRGDSLLQSLFALTAAVVILAFQPVNASGETWTAISPGDLLTASNWGGTTPNGVDAVAIISTQPTNTGSFGLNGTMTLGTLNYSNPLDRGIAGIGTLNLAATNGTPTISVNSGTLTITANIAGTDGMTKTGTRPLFLINANTYSGGTVIDGGGIVATNVSGSATGSGSVTINSGSGLQLGINSATGSVSGNIINNGFLLFSRSDDYQYVGVISGTGRVRHDSTGTTTLSDNNSYSGGTSITSGTLSGNSINNQGMNSSFGLGSFSISNGGTLQYTGGAAETNRTIMLDSGGGAVATNSQLVVRGEVSGIGGLTKTGTGSLGLYNTANSYSGSTNVVQGTLFPGGHEMIPNGSPVTVAIDGRLDLNNVIETIGSLAGAGRISIRNGSSLTTGGDNSSTTFSGIIDGDGSLTKTGAGTMTISGGNDYTGTTTITGGTLTFATAVPGGAGLGNFVISNAMLEWAQPDTDSYTHQAIQLSGNGTVSISVANTTWGTGGTISGAGMLIKEGVGTLRLYGDNSYSGGTDVRLGTLFVTSDSGSATGSGSVNVNAGAALAGTGIIAGAVTSAGTVAPGLFPEGTLHVLGNYSQSSSGKLEIDLLSQSSFDKLQIGGSMSLDGDLEISLVGGYVPEFGTQFDILDFTSVTGAFSSLTLPLLASGLQWDTSQIYTSGVLSVGPASDYNHDNVIDAADYVVWRKRGGSGSEYSLWRSRFGNAGSQSEVGARGPVGAPEPHTGLSLVVAFCLINATSQLLRTDKHRRRI
jgi:autotransporter-associated beta strand protein